MLVPPRGWWRVVAVTCELDGSDWVPLVRHEFYGATRAAARNVFRAHMATDEFLRECTERGCFRGITCRTETYVLQIS